MKFHLNLTKTSIIDEIGYASSPARGLANW